MSSAPSPYSPPNPMPAFTTIGKTRTAADLARSSCAPPTRQEKFLSVECTRASISGPELASAPATNPPSDADAKQAPSDIAWRRLMVRMMVPSVNGQAAIYANPAFTPLGEPLAYLLGNNRAELKAK